MIYFIFILFLFSVLPKSDTVKVNLRGSISLGKDVVDTLTYYVNKSQLSGRRSFGGKEVNHDEKQGSTDPIVLIVRSAFLCRNLEFCKDDLGTLLNKYIIMLTRVVENVFHDFATKGDKQLGENTPKTVIFEDELTLLISHIRKWVKNANDIANADKNDITFTWTRLMKQINAKFQESAINFASKRLEGKVKDVSIVKTEITQKLITLMTEAEIQFENKLCYEKNICPQSYECTSALKTLLEQLNNLPDERIQEFIRSFYETIPATSFYYRISDVTGHEFQTILHNMAYNDLSAKQVLTPIQKIVETRLKAITTRTKDVRLSGRDVKLIYVILSDMDHFYSKQKKEPFYDFLGDFFEWSQKGGRFNSQLRSLMKDLQSLLSFESDELVFKLVNEVRVFMEVTVDPQP